MVRVTFFGRRLDKTRPRDSLVLQFEQPRQDQFTTQLQSDGGRKKAEVWDVASFIPFILRGNQSGTANRMDSVSHTRSESGVGAVTPLDAAILGGRWCRLACDYHESTAIFARRRGTRAAGWLGGWAAGRLGGGWG